MSSALLIPLAALAPFVAATPAETIKALRYEGLPGFGGISLLLQPDLLGWRWGHPVAPSALTLAVSRHQSLIVGFVLGALTLLLLYRKTTALEGAVLLWLGLYAFGVDFGPHYLVWGLPFFLMAGHLRAAAALQAAILAPSLILYLKLPAIGAYEITMVVIWVGFLVAFVAQLRSVLTTDHRADAR